MCEGDELEELDKEAYYADRFAEILGHIMKIGFIITLGVLIFLKSFPVMFN